MSISFNNNNEIKIYDSETNTARYTQNEAELENISLFDEVKEEDKNKNRYNPDFDDDNELSAVLPSWINKISGIIIDAFDGESKDGAIDYTEQNNTGDCWLLAGINSLSYTEAGREAIKNALEYHDVYTVVHLKGVGDYIVKDSEVSLTKANYQYSSGDDDMIILELAIEKVLDDIANGRIIVDENAPSYIENKEGVQATVEFRSSTVGGWPNELWYILTGNGGTRTGNTDKMNKFLDEFQNDNGKNIALGAINLGKDDRVEDIYGTKHKLVAQHAYSIKKVTDDTVTVINPWDSSEEIVLSRDKFLETFEKVTKCDLSDDSAQKNYLSFCAKNALDKEISYAERQVECDKAGNVIVRYLDEDGNTKIIEQHDKNGRFSSIIDYSFGPDPVTVDIEYDENGNVISKRVHTDTGKAGLKYTYDEEGNAKITLYDIDKKGNITDKNWKISEEAAQKIIERHLLDIKTEYTIGVGLANDIYTSELWNVSDEKWEILDDFFLNISPDMINLQDLGKYATLDIEEIYIALYELSYNKELPADILYLKLSGMWTDEEFHDYLEEHNIEYKTYEEIYGKLKLDFIKLFLHLRRNLWPDNFKFNKNVFT